MVEPSSFCLGQTATATERKRGQTWMLDKHTSSLHAEDRLLMVLQRCRGPILIDCLLCQIFRSFHIFDRSPKYQLRTGLPSLAVAPIRVMLTHYSYSMQLIGAEFVRLLFTCGSKNLVVQGRHMHATAANAVRCVAQGWPRLIYPPCRSVPCFMQMRGRDTCARTHKWSSHDARLHAPRPHCCRGPDYVPRSWLRWCQRRIGQRHHISISRFFVCHGSILAVTLQPGFASCSVMPSRK